tara:strand:- start:14018 stop:15151 length:1134 start_codon:yes stop_codon:yes gene_type:complete
MNTFNIRSVIKNGKKVYRYKYYGTDGKIKFLHNPVKAMLIKKVIVKTDEVGFIKTTASEFLFPEAYALWTKHLNYKRSEGKISQSSIDDYDSFYRNHISIFFKDIDIRNITKDMVSEFVSTLRSKSINSQTLSKVFNTLSAMLQYAKDSDKIIKNICKEKNYLVNVIISKAEPVEINFDKLDIDTVIKIIKNIKRPEISLLCLIMLETACRPSEALALSKDDLDFKSNVPLIKITNAVKRGKKLGSTKTNTGKRVLAISAGLKDKIQAHIAKLPNHQESLFLNRLGKYICVEQLIRGLEKSLDELGIKLPSNRKSYFFRHYMATYWAKTNKYKNPLDLAKALGHKDINFTIKTYIKPFEDKSKEFEKSEYQNEHFKY